MQAASAVEGQGAGDQVGLGDRRAGHHGILLDVVVQGIGAHAVDGVGTGGAARVEADDVEALNEAPEDREVPLDELDPTRPALPG